MSNKILSKLYFDPTSPCAFAGAATLFREARKHGIKKTEVDNFLSRQEAYTLHKQTRRRFPRNKTITVGMDADWQVDLADMQRLSKTNDGINFLLVCVDVLSKFAWVRPLRNKTSTEVAKAFENILQTSNGRKPWRVYSDKGTEFIGRPFQKMLKQNDIQFIQSESPDVKASLAENFIKIMKSRLWKYFTKTASYKYVGVLQKIVTGLNNRFHRVIKRKPSEVTFANEREVWELLYGKKNKPVKFRFSVGDKVRILRKKETFEQGYLHNFTKEIFTITEKVRRNPPIYKIKDWEDEKITGIFYESELVKVVQDDDEVYKIEKVLRSRIRNGNRELFVKWDGYPAKFNSWLPAKEVVTVA